MKKIVKTVCALAIAVGFASCEKEQSSLDVSAFTEQATVKGIASYNSGYDASTSFFVKVLANQILNYVILIDDGILATGSTTTDGNGMYSISVPTSYGLNSDVIITVNFEADYALNTTITRKAVFSGSAYAVSLMPHEIQVVDIFADENGIIQTPDDLN
ncbi:MAG: hypothetical protein LBU90_09550 [Bacteroidales bacterium]|nr:hypothetical protein [Bacteroidales bacterium]